MSQPSQVRTPEIGVKDNIAVAGVPTGNGLGRAGITAAKDAAVVARLRKAGHTFVPAQPMDEAAFGATGENPHRGRVENPAAPGRSPGGSSCGGAAAVAAGMWAALGTDTLGSVRIPAAYCGIVGFKPSRGVLPMPGVAPLSPSMDELGILAREIGVVEALLKVFLNPKPARIRAPRVLVPKSMETDAPTEVAFAAAMARMQTLGAGWRIKHAALTGWLPEQHRRAALLLIEAEGASVHRELVDGDDPAMSPPVRAALRYGRDAESRRLVAAVQELRSVEQALAAVFQRYDLIATPTVPAPAYRWEEGPPANQAVFTALANWAGLPAISLPLPAQGAPIGLQLIGPPGQDWPLLRDAAYLMKAGEADCPA